MCVGNDAWLAEAALTFPVAGAGRDLIGEVRIGVSGFQFDST